MVLIKKIKGMNYVKLKTSTLFLATSMFVMSLSAQDGGALFKQNCTACHSIGKGKLVGPDLKSIHNRRDNEWIVSFVKNAADFGVKDADAKAIIDEFGYPMPNQALTDEEILAIVDYIKENSPAETETTAAETESIEEEQVDPALDPVNASKEDVVLGSQLFSGEKRLTNGGPSCLSCHSVEHDALIGGGLLAKDLTMVYERMGSAGINGILSAPPFPAMTASYQNNPLTEEEIFQLSAFFVDASVNSVYQHKKSFNDNLLIYGGGGAFLLFAAIISLLFIERKKKCVKQSIYDRQIKAETSK